MKKLLSVVFLMFVLVATSALLTSAKPDALHTIEGTWELESFYTYGDGVNITDTVPKAKGYRQVKIYSKGHIMWTRYVPDEPNGRFGYGTYKITEDELVETIEYGDDQMMKALDTMRVFSFQLQLEDNAFSQISFDEDNNRTFSENYRRID